MNMRSATLCALVVASACGPTGRPDNMGGDGEPTIDAAPVIGPEVCDDAYDNDGDGRADCSDVDCSGIGACPVCGAVDNPEAQPLALPDGVSSGLACTTNTQCTSPSEPNCVARECHASYTSTLNFVGFPMGATLTDPSKLLKVCVKMEHSWLRDLQMDLITPSGVIMILHEFVDRTGGECYLGMANDSDSAASPVPGIGEQYCWTATAPLTMMMAATSNYLPPGDYKSISPWTAMMNTELNGPWTMRVTDLWGIDNGFLFEWSIEFDPTLVNDCAGPIIL